MSIKSSIALSFASYINKINNKWIRKPIETQEKCFTSLIQKASNTAFGKDHDFNAIQTHSDFVQRVPIRDYEALKPYFEKVTQGERDVLWPAKPIYLAKTSGTTSGAKYIPITSDSIHNHINSARNALLAYVYETKKSAFLNGKLIFLSGSPELTKTAGIPTGRLSGIVNHHVPAYLRGNQLPSYSTNCIDDWETKVEQIVNETLHQNMTLISGIPPWVQMYFDKIQEKTGKSISEVFPNFNVFVYGGVNFEPYRPKLQTSIGKKLAGIELFPASEGFFAYQNSQEEQGMLLQLNSGIFYEFVPSDQFFEANPPRLTLDQVKLDTNYVMIISSNAGLWAYNIGDCVKFTSLFPFKIVVTGRIKHFISAFGEHVIGEEVDKAMQFALLQQGGAIAEYTVAPQVNPSSGLPYHEWFIAFDTLPSDLNAFANALNQSMVAQNIYYKDLIEGAILRPLKVTTLPANAFIQYMKQEGKLGGQNKVPRLSNDRKIADALTRLFH